MIDEFGYDPAMIYYSCEVVKRRVNMIDEFGYPKMGFVAVKT